MKVLFEIEYRGKILSEDEIKNNKELVVHLYQNKLIELNNEELEEYGLKEYGLKEKEVIENQDTEKQEKEKRKTRRNRRKSK